MALTKRTVPPQLILVVIVPSSPPQLILAVIVPSSPPQLILVAIVPSSPPQLILVVITLMIGESWEYLALTRSRTLEQALHLLHY